MSIGSDRIGVRDTLHLEITKGEEIPDRERPPHAPDPDNPDLNPDIDVDPDLDPNRDPDPDLNPDLTPEEPAPEEAPVEEDGA